MRSTEISLECMKVCLFIVLKDQFEYGLYVVRLCFRWCDCMCVDGIEIYVYKNEKYIDFVVVSGVSVNICL